MAWAYSSDFGFALSSRYRSDRRRVLDSRAAARFAVGIATAGAWHRP
jgi:hypothetical protein